MKEQHIQAQIDRGLHFERDVGPETDVWDLEPTEESI